MSEGMPLWAERLSRLCAKNDLRETEILGRQSSRWLTWGVAFITWAYQAREEHHDHGELKPIVGDSGPAGFRCERCGPCYGPRQPASLR